MAHWLLDLPFAGCALVLCFVLAWRAPLFGVVLGAAACASLWLQPQGEVAVRVAIAAAAWLGAVVAVPRLASALVALVEVAADVSRARWRRPSLRAVTASRTGAANK